MITLEILHIISIIVMMLSFCGIVWKYKKDRQFARLISALVMTLSGCVVAVCSIIKTIMWIIEYYNLR